MKSTSAFYGCSLDVHTSTTRTTCYGHPREDVVRMLRGCNEENCFCVQQHGRDTARVRLQLLRLVQRVSGCDDVERVVSGVSGISTTLLLPHASPRDLAARLSPPPPHDLSPSPTLSGGIEAAR